MTREETLEKAKKCVSGGRELSYGEPENNFALIATFWNGYLKAKSTAESKFWKEQNGEKNPEKNDAKVYEITGDDVAVMMALLKVARIATSPTGATFDNYVDLAGYAACAAELASEFEDHGVFPLAYNA